jgi:hypothetical protein
MDSKNIGFIAVVCTRRPYDNSAALEHLMKTNVTAKEAASVTVTAASEWPWIKLQAAGRCLVRFVRPIYTRFPLAHRPTHSITSRVFILKAEDFTDFYRFFTAVRPRLGSFETEDFTQIEDFTDFYTTPPPPIRGLSTARQLWPTGQARRIFPPGSQIVHRTARSGVMHTLQNSQFTRGLRFYAGLAPDSRLICCSRLAILRSVAAASGPTEALAEETLLLRRGPKGVPQSWPEGLTKWSMAAKLWP